MQKSPVQFLFDLVFVLSLQHHNVQGQTDGYKERYDDSNARNSQCDVRNSTATAGSGNTGLIYIRSSGRACGIGYHGSG